MHQSEQRRGQCERKEECAPSSALLRRTRETPERERRVVTGLEEGGLSLRTKPPVSTGAAR